MPSTSSSSTEPDRPSPDAAGFRFDVIVVGLGIMGLATCRELAKRGLSVLGLEQFDLFHKNGSSHGSTRVIRRSYFEHPGYVPIVDRAWDGWREIERETDTTLLRQCGVLSMGTPDSTLVKGVLQSMKTHNIPHEVLSPEAITERFPAFDLNGVPGATGVLEPGGGYVYALRSLEALAASARQHGAMLRDVTFVESWKTTGSGVEVRAENGTYRAGHLVLTTGPWIRDLMDELGVSIELVRKLLFWYMPTDEKLIHPDNCPCFLHDGPSGQYYGVPDNLDTPENGLKLGRHDLADSLREVAILGSGAELRIENWVEEQDDLERPMVEDFARAALAPALLTGDPPELVLTDRTVCQYTMAPDQHFIIDRHPGHDRVIMAGGFSGHGFKFAPAVGMLIADLVQDQPSWPEADFLRLARFTKR